ncbi:hypothetical protein AXK60_24155 [Tsukamurella pseudospumae]|uniref:DUF4397 domain-containing protein n=2 Tax=Tsukamurella pseudospumae TaxID=239498 RepID=A0A138AP05_9ACTN|nr:hypothetical protein AXK61_13065 [Tsukamurella pseudospumae]KXP12154.1 hypothetical protein AXK60_24155 [Tsukamurella pseudospumae]
MVAPDVLLDGRRVFTAIGPTLLPVPPGAHRIDVVENYLGSSTPVATVVNVAPGQLVDVYYAPPFTRFTSGRIGVVPQERPGQGPAVAVYTYVAVSFVVMLILMMISWVAVLSI